MIYTEVKYFCPHCGAEHKPEDETEMGVFCNCGMDYWLSECITKEIK